MMKTTDSDMLWSSHPYSFLYWLWHRLDKSILKTNVVVTPQDLRSCQQIYVMFLLCLCLLSVSTLPKNSNCCNLSKTIQYMYSVVLYKFRKLTIYYKLICIICKKMHEHGHPQSQHDQFHLYMYVIYQKPALSSSAEKLLLSLVVSII